MSNPELELAMQQAGEVANTLVQKSKNYSKVVAGMLASRRLYSFCLHELVLLLEDSEINKEFLPEAITELSNEHKTIIKEILINAAASQACNPFDETQLKSDLKDTVLPWVTSVSDKHNKQEQKLKKEALASAEVRRLNTPLTTDLPIYETKELDRLKPIVFIGNDAVVAWVLNHMDAEFKANSNIQTVRLANSNKPGFTFNHCSLGFTVWHNCAVNAASVKRLLLELITPKIPNPMDVLIVDNLVQTCDKKSFLIPQCNDAQKIFSDVAKKAGFLLVSGIHLGRELRFNELHQAEYESLRMFNTLRSVATVDVDDTNCMVQIGVQQYGPVAKAEIYGA